MFNQKLIAKYSAILDKLPPSSTALAALQALLNEYLSSLVSREHGPLAKKMLDILAKESIVNKQQRIFWLLSGYLTKNTDSTAREAKGMSSKSTLALDGDFFSLWLVFFRKYPFLLAQLEPDNQGFYALWLFDAYQKANYDKFHLNYRLHYGDRPPRLEDTQLMQLFIHATGYFSGGVADYLINTAIEKYNHESELLNQLLFVETSSENREKIKKTLEKYYRFGLKNLREHAPKRNRLHIALGSAVAILTSAQQQEMLDTHLPLWKTHSKDDSGSKITQDILRITRMIPHLQPEVLQAVKMSFRQYFDTTLTDNVELYQQQIQMANALLEGLFSQDPVPEIPVYLVTFLLATLDHANSQYAYLAMPGFSWIFRRLLGGEEWNSDIQQKLVLRLLNYVENVSTREINIETIKPLFLAMQKVLSAENCRLLINGLISLVDGSKFGRNFLPVSLLGTFAPKIIELGLAEKISAFLKKSLEGEQHKKLESWELQLLHSTNIIYLATLAQIQPDVLLPAIPLNLPSLSVSIESSRDRIDGWAQQAVLVALDDFPSVFSRLSTAQQDKIFPEILGLFGVSVAKKKQSYYPALWVQLKCADLLVKLMRLRPDRVSLVASEAGLLCQGFLSSSDESALKAILLPILIERVAAENPRPRKQLIKEPAKPKSAEVATAALAPKLLADAKQSARVSSLLRQDLPADPSGDEGLESSPSASVKDATESMEGEKESEAPLSSMPISFSSFFDSLAAIEREQKKRNSVLMRDTRKLIQPLSEMWRKRTAEPERSGAVTPPPVPTAAGPKPEQEPTPKQEWCLHQ